MWIGEYTLGDRLPLTLWVRSGVAPTVPDDPVRAIVSSSTKQIESLLLPIIDKGNETAIFHKDISLDGKYSTGEHSVQYIYEHSSTVRSELHRFWILAGGSASGTGIAAEYFSVSPSKYILVQNDMGTLIRRKNPSIS